MHCLYSIEIYLLLFYTLSIDVDKYYIGKVDLKSSTFHLRFSSLYLHFSSLYSITPVVLGVNLSQIGVNLYTIELNPKLVALGKICFVSREILELDKVQVFHDLFWLIRRAIRFTSMAIFYFTRRIMPKNMLFWLSSALRFSTLEQRGSGSSFPYLSPKISRIQS